MTLSIFATLALLLLAAIARFLTRDWCHPAVVFCLFWFCGCSLPVLVAPENITSGSGALWILLNAIFVVSGGVLGTALGCSSFERRRAASKASAPHAQVWPYSKLRSHTWIAIVLGLVFVPLCLRSQGIGLGELKSFQAIAKTALRMALMRYSNTGQSIPGYVELFLSASYLAPLLGSTLFVERRGRSDVALALVALLPCVASFAVQSTKAAVLYGATMWMSGYLATRTWRGFTTPQVRLRVFALVAASVPAIFLFLALGDFLRGGGHAAQSPGPLIGNRAKNYVGGHLPALSYWLDQEDRNEGEAIPGRNTFAGLYQMANAGERLNGVYTESVSVSTGSTNVYTYFRPLVEEYTRPGSLLLIFGLSGVAGFSYRRVLDGSRGWTGLLVCCYAGTLWGVSSIFNYNSILLALLLYSLWWIAGGQVDRQRRPDRSLAMARRGGHPPLPQNA